MMFARQAVLGGISQYAAKHPAQRVARQHIVSDMIGRHCESCRVQMPLSDQRRCPWPDSLRTYYSGRGPGSAGLAAGGGYSSKSFGHELKWRLLLPGASEPRLAELNPLGL